MFKNSKIYVAGHTGLMGSAILRKLQKDGYKNIIVRTHNDLDLTRQDLVEKFFEKEKPEYVFLCAAKVGGIFANSTFPVEFAYTNLMIGTNIITSSYKYGVKKLMNFGSNCIYPKLATQPIKEEYLLTGELEKTNEAYSIAKIATLKLCTYYNKQYKTNYITVMPQNLYGIGDHFDMQKAHLLPMVIRRLHLAKLLSENDFDGIRKDLKANKLGWGIDDKIDFNSEKSIEEALSQVGAFKDKAIFWGDGSPYREFLLSDDVADGCLYLMENKDYVDIGECVNLCSGGDIQIKDIIKITNDVVGFKGIIEFDTGKPNGVPRKLLDNTKIKELGWKPKIELQEGVKIFYDYYLKRSN